jgi:hypothetical protein
VSARPILAAVLLALCLRSAGAETWAPERTWALVVGLYHFKDPNVYSDFETEGGRADDALVRALEGRGVPRRQILHLRDRGASRNAIERALASTAARCGRRDTLLVYLGSHGDRDEDGTCYFVPYEGGEDSAATSLPFVTIVSILDRAFHGERILMAVDTCNAGGAVEVLRRKATRNPFACIASCLADEESNDWDFTDCLTDGILGRPGLDLDGDGAVTLDEMIRYTEAEMAFGQEQIVDAFQSPSLPRPLVMAPASGPRPRPPVGDHVEARDEGDWYKARVIEARPHRLRVHFYGYTDSNDLWVPLPDVRPHRARRFPPGTRVTIEPDDDDEDTVEATVVGARGEAVRVRYEDGTEEWVEARRLKARI